MVLSEEKDCFSLFLLKEQVLVLLNLGKETKRKTNTVLSSWYIQGFNHLFYSCKYDFKCMIKLHLRI